MAAKTTNVHLPEGVEATEDGVIVLSTYLGTSEIKVERRVAAVPDEVLEQFLGSFPGAEVKSGTPASDK